MPSRLALLRLSSAMLALAPAALASAQTAPATDATAEAAEEIVVVGLRPIAESEAAALAFQRESLSLVSVVSSDAVGRLPDQNVAQAISRLPGVGVQRDQGQARYVNLRGAPLDWTTLSFNGINVVSPEGRDARFDSLPSAIASKIVVQKAVTPDMSSETIAGNVDIITRSPFDYRGLHVAAKGGAGRVDLGNQAEYEASLVFANRFGPDRSFGILVSGSYYERGQRTDNFEADWEVVTRDQRPGFEDRVWAREIENKLYRLIRRNYSLSGRLEWQPGTGNRLWVETVYSIFEDDEFRDNYRLDTDDQESRVPNSPLPCSPPPPQPPAANTTGYADVCTGNTPFAGTVFGIDYDARFRQTAYRQSVFTNTLGGEHEFDGWKLSWRGNYTRSVDDRSQPFLLTYTQPGFGTNGAGAVNRTTTIYDLTNPNAHFFTIYRTLRSPTGVLSRGEQVSRFDQLPNGLNSLASLVAKDVTDAYTARVDVSHELGGADGSTELRFGGRFDQRTKVANETSNRLTGGANFTALGIPTGLDALLVNGTEYSGKLNLGYSFNHFNQNLAKAWTDRVRFATPAVPVFNNFYDVREQIWSGYAMGVTRFAGGNIVYGARLEHTTNTGQAFVTLGGQRQLIETSSSTTLVFPSAHLNLDVRTDMKVRFSFTTGAARPDYDVLRPNFTFNDANQTVSGGNPDARPERAWGLDAYWEWYVQPRGFVSFGAYYKRARDVLFEDTRPFDRDILNEPGVDRSGYTLNTIVNGGSGYIAGVEGAVQLQLDPFLANDSFFGGFGIQANLTLNTSRAETPDGRRIRFPGASDYVFNIGPYFEKYGISARVSYQKRTTWFSEVGGPDTGGDIYWATDDELDASIRYAISRQFEIYADGSNLLNGPGRRFAGISERTLEYERFGRRFTAGVRFTY